MLSMFPCCAVNGILIDRNPDSEFVLAKPHGRVDIAACVTKIALALVFSLNNVSTSLLLAVLAVSAAILLYGYVRFLPFYSPTVSSYHCAFATLYAWATFCVITAYIRNTPGEDVEGFAFLMSSPAVLFTGYAFARQRFFAFGSFSSEHNPNLAATTASAPTSACLVELRQRQLLAHVEGFHQPHTRSVGADPSQPGQTEAALAAPGTNDYASNNRECNDPTMAPMGNRADTVDLAVHRPVLLKIDKLYETAVAGPDCSALLRLFLAQYVRVYCANRHMEQLELKALQSMSLPFDVAFFVYQRCRELKLEEKASRVAGTMTVETHMKFDTYKARADRQVLSARENQAELWLELANANPSMSRLETIGTSIERRISEANESFQAMLKLNPNSVAAMRRYAEFLQEVMGSTYNASEGDSLTCPPRRGAWEGGMSVSVTETTTCASESLLVCYLE